MERDEGGPIQAPCQAQMFDSVKVTDQTPYTRIHDNNVLGAADGERARAVSRRVRRIRNGLLP